MTVTITESAATKVGELLAREVPAGEEVAEYALRIAVQPGGCAGLRYAPTGGMAREERGGGVDRDGGVVDSKRSLTEAGSNGAPHADTVS
jgi:Fe-S cluster assembly iron-binding protein IscA